MSCSELLRRTSIESAHAFGNHRFQFGGRNGAQRRKFTERLNPGAIQFRVLGKIFGRGGRFAVSWRINSSRFFDLQCGIGQALGAMVELFSLRMLRPHNDPAPWAGYTKTASGRRSNLLCRLSYIMPASCCGV